MEPNAVTEGPVRFEVHGLFDRFNHLIPLPTADQPVRYLSAPNGYGKSTALRLLAALAEGRWNAAGDTYFKSAAVVFSSGEKLELSKESTAPAHLLLRRLAADGTVVAEWEPDISIPELNPGELPPWIRQTGPNRFRDIRSGIVMSGEETARRFLRDPGSRASRPSPRVPKDLDELLSKLVVYYLDADRLRSTIRDEISARGPMPEAGSIEMVSQLIYEELRRSRAEYARASREAERTFPQRILSSLSALTGADAGMDLDERYARLRSDERRFTELSLADGVTDDIPEQHLQSATLNDTARTILHVYLHDIEQRFALLEPVANRLTLFKDTLNRMLDSKSVDYVYSALDASQQRRALQARADLEVPQQRSALQVRDERDREIPLTALSSGEQHLVVMFGRILFRESANNGALVLLDEPEISLHPEWQVSLGRALREVARVNACRMILATHSPIMIDEDWESEIDLSASDI
jgi:predicted ATPase